jgi:hypothetical protein
MDFLKIAYETEGPLGIPTKDAKAKALGIVGLVSARGGGSLFRKASSTNDHNGVEVTRTIALSEPTGRT